ncbi:DUF3006 family protein [Clostridium sp. JN-1]
MSCEAKEGDVLTIDKCIKIDFEETVKRKSRIKGLADDMWNR